MTTLPRFGVNLDKWFGRKNIPIWLTEYGHETRPEDPKGVTYAQQASYLRTAVDMARRNPRVGMLIWFAIRDNPVNAWQSGLMTQFGLEKPAFDAYSVLAKPLDARNAFVTVKGGVANPAVRVRHDEARLPQRRGLARRAHVQGLPEGPPARRRAACRCDRDRRLDHDPAAVHAGHAASRTRSRSRSAT